jgi:alanine dehydrogenase
MEIEMIIGLPKEIKNNENRVGLTPGGTIVLVNNGHTVFVEKSAGIGSGLLEQMLQRWLWGSVQELLFSI